MIEPLSDVIAGRDERAAVQALMLKEAGDSGTNTEDFFLCQITLNIPGYPKRLPGDIESIFRCREKFLCNCAASLKEEKNICNGAGLCWIALFEGGGEEACAAKLCAVAVEESVGGVIFDIDIIMLGGHISRESLGLPPRKCMICREEAKVCARGRSHPLEELRRAAEFLLNSF